MRTDARSRLKIKIASKNPSTRIAECWDFCLHLKLTTQRKDAARLETWALIPNARPLTQGRLQAAGQVDSIAEAMASSWQGPGRHRGAFAARAASHRHMP